MKKHNYILLFFFLPLLLNAQNNKDNKMKFNGFVDTYHAVRSKSPNDFISSRSRLRGELKVREGNSYLYSSFNIEENSVLENQSGFELKEAYLNYSSDNWNIRAGRQIIIWGAADGVRITDLLSPMDYTEFLARDYDDIRMPIDAFRFRYFKNNMKLDFVLVPTVTPFIIPVNYENPWAFKFSNLTKNIKILKENKPEKKIANSEIGMRLSYALPGIDFSLAGLYTWDKMPILRSKMIRDTLFVNPEYHRMTFLGGDISKPLGQFVFRGEVAVNFTKHFLCTEIEDKLDRKNTINYLLGIDWYPAGEWTIMTQFSCESILNYSQKIRQEEHKSLITNKVSKKLFNSSLEISDFTYYDVNNNAFFSRFSSDYSLSDQIHLCVGYDWFHGDKGMFGMYKDNSEMWIKAKYSF